MTNEEFYTKKIDEEYQKYLKSLKVPSKEDWLKMTHEEETHHKFNVGDIISICHRPCYIDVNITFVIYKIDFNTKMYYIRTPDGGMFADDIQNVDAKYNLA